MFIQYHEMAQILFHILIFNRDKLNTALGLFLCHADVLTFYRFDLEKNPFEPRRKMMF